MSNLSKYEKLLYKHNRLKRHCGNQMNKIVECKQELQRKDNIIKELEKWLNENNLYKTNDNILAKLKELENDNK